MSPKGKFLILLGIITILGIIQLNRSAFNLSGEWTYGVVGRPTSPGQAFIYQRGNKIEMLMNWTPQSAVVKPPHYKILGEIHDNQIVGTWIHYGCELGEHPRTFSAEIVSEGEAIRILKTDDPNDHHNFNKVVMNKLNRKNPFDF